MSSHHHLLSLFFFFFNDTATTEIYTLSLHDALPICGRAWAEDGQSGTPPAGGRGVRFVIELPLEPSPQVAGQPGGLSRSEEHTSELQSQSNLVCRLLLEKKKKKTDSHHCTRDTNSEH